MREIENQEFSLNLIRFCGYQPLIRAYIGQGLRADLKKLEEAPITKLVENLKKQGVSREEHRVRC